MRILCIILVCNVLVWSCKPMTQEEKELKTIIDNVENPDALVGENPSKTNQKKEYKNFEIPTTTGVAFIVSEQPKSASISNISISGKSFEHPVFDTLKATDPLENILLADLNNDSFKEIYLITRTTGSGSYATIYGFASYADKSFGPIYVPDLSLSKELPFGYLGHDSIYINNGQLIRTFPLYNGEDTNSQPTGETATIVYDLIKGEAGFILQPDL